MSSPLAMVPECAAPQPRVRRVLVFFLTVSFAAHAAVIVLAPEFSFESILDGPSLLEVTIVSPEPLPVAEPAAPLPAPPQAARLNEPKAATRPKRETRKPLTAVPGPEPVIENPVTAVVPQRVPERQAAVPGPTTGTAPAPAATPPSHAAAYLRNPPPQYPMASRLAGEEGTVILRVLVRRDGVPGRVEIRKSSGWHNLDAAASDAIWNWRFVPGREGNDVVEATMEVPITFRLKEAAEGVSRSR